MGTFADMVLVFVLLINLVLLGSSRLASCIRQVAIQGVVLGILPILVAGDAFHLRLLVLASGVFLLKGFVFPNLLFRSMRTANTRHEATPIIGQTASVVMGVVIVVASFWLTSSLELPPAEQAASDLVVPVSLATLLTGLLLIVSRHQALSQVVGYLVLENGVFIFGAALARDEPLLVEMGVLLDVLVAVLVMGIAMFHISRTFDHIDVEQLSQLRD